MKLIFKGQFGSLYFFDGGVKPNFACNIKQWGNINVINEWERFAKAHSNADLVISAIDEPQFAEGVSLYRAFEDTTGGIFTADALASVESWDSDKFGNGQRVFENGADQPNLNKWSFSGGDMAYGFYMRNNMSSITNSGKNMRPNNIAGFAGYASDAFGDSFQGATGIHNWEKLNDARVVDAQYFVAKHKS